MGETNKLKYNLLKQYLNGQLDPRGMHELEKDALEDPFLAEALDGYAEIKGSLHPHLSILQRQLEDRIAQNYVKKNTIFFTWQRLSVAAAASLLFVSASILYWMKGTDRSAKIAVNPKQTEVKLTAADRLGKEESDTNLTDDEQLDAATAPNKAVQSGTVLSTNSKVKTVTHSFSSPADLSGSATNSKVQAAGTAATKESFARVPREKDKKDDVKIVANNQTASIATMANTDLLIASAPKVKLPGAAHMRSVVIAQEPQFNSLNEAVVVGYARSTKQSVAQPAAGWETYREYLARNLNTELKTTTKDSVTVVFNVDTKGNPINLHIEKGIDELRNQEAIRLIKQGPLWQSNTGEALLQGRITVPF